MDLVCLGFISNDTNFFFIHFIGIHRYEIMEAENLIIQNIEQFAITSRLTDFMKLCKNASNSSCLLNTTDFMVYYQTRVKKTNFFYGRIVGICYTNNWMFSYQLYYELWLLKLFGICQDAWYGIISQRIVTVVPHRFHWYRFHPLCVII